MLRPLLAIAAPLALFLSPAPAAAQARLSPQPPEVPLWRTDAAGNAIQNDLGFFLPPRIGSFERKGFTSTREDGGSVMSWYESADGRLILRILLQLRADIRGITLEGADGVERNWQFLERVGDAEFGAGTGEELAERRIVWGTGDHPNAMMRLSRFADPSGAPRVQGLWYRNIGMWAVVIVASGPEAARGEVEAAGAAAMALPWPRAPMTAELLAMRQHFRETARECRDYERSGSGRPVQPGPAIRAMLALGLAVTFLDTARAVPHPALQPDLYCRIETFRVGQDEYIALGRIGDTNAYPAARYAFMRSSGGTLYQIESFFSGEEVPAEERRGISRLVWLTASNHRRVTALRVFSDWPSYADAKAIVTQAARGQRDGLAELMPTGFLDITHPAAGITINMDPSRPAPLPSAPSAPAEPPPGK
ncbi:MAG TPA: hypothetical protein VF702_02295 [Allosphingosinicella sp.]|jgi:hypothetical protein